MYDQQASSKPVVAYCLTLIGGLFGISHRAFLAVHNHRRLDNNSQRIDDCLRAEAHGTTEREL